MSLLAVGSVAYDSVETPFGKVDDVLGGSATYFSLSASFFTSVQLVACVGKDFKGEHRALLESRNVDVQGLQVLEGRTFRWKGSYGYDLNDAKTLHDFAALVQSRERLKLLLILTVADIRAVGPGVWTGWKGQLLRTLYFETEPLLGGGHTTLTRSERVARARMPEAVGIIGGKHVDRRQRLARMAP